MGPDIFSNMKTVSKAILDNVASLDAISDELTRAVQRYAFGVSTVAMSAVETEEVLTLFSQQVAEVTRAVTAAFEEWPEPTRRALTSLGQRGWYISLQMSLSALYEQACQVEEGNYSEVDEWMSSYYQKNTSRIKNDLQERFPNRAPILTRVFEAHLRGKYELSVPVFLSQADSVCFELTGRELYSKNPKKTVATFVDQLATQAIIDAMMDPFRASLPIKANQKERKSPDYPPGSLNRHEILHGIDVEYPSRINSYKAMSLLHYTATLLDKYAFEDPEN